MNLELLYYNQTALKKNILPYKMVELLYYFCLDWLIHVSYCVSLEYYSFKAELTVTNDA